MNNDETLLGVLVGFLIIAAIKNNSFDFNSLEFILIIILGITLLLILGIYYWKYFSKKGRERKSKNELILDIPLSLKHKSDDSIYLGLDGDLNIPIYLSDQLRSRHVHILGATGSGKTESVILNFLKQDIERGLGAVILDAKGDQSFIDHLKKWVPIEKLKVFDLADGNSIGFDPLRLGSPLEAAQRLFSSLIWSEEFYKSKALSALQAAFQYHFNRHGKNPYLSQLKRYFDNQEMLSEVLGLDIKCRSTEKEFTDLSGLRDQLRSLTVGHLEKLLSPLDQREQIDLSSITKGNIIYFRLQSLLSPSAVQILGRLLIQKLNYLAGQTHRGEGAANGVKLIPIYLDEFASFASPEFADLISKARSAGFALHFSHQSIGDLEEVSKGFLNRITDNSATKIILRINDPDSAEFFARSFGTRLYQKFTQKVIQSREEIDAELVGEGTSREAHQFRSGPDNFKTLPTGMGSVLIAHGFESREGASHVFKIKFPRLQNN